LLEDPQSRLPRRMKFQWDPCEISQEKFAKFFGEVERAVGLEITNEEKVIQTLKQYNMSQEETLEKIRRNKAHYKNYFRVQKLAKTRLV